MLPGGGGGGGRSAGGGGGGFCTRSPLGGLEHHRVGHLVVPALKAQGDQDPPAGPPRLATLGGRDEKVAAEPSSAAPATQRAGHGVWSTTELATLSCQP